jgi:hypothetical protein
MGSRASVFVTRIERVHGGDSPNQYVGRVSVDLRAFYPPHLGHEALTAAMIRDAADEAIRQLEGSE